MKSIQQLLTTSLKQLSIIIALILMNNITATAQSVTVTGSGCGADGTYTLQSDGTYFDWSVFPFKLFSGAGNWSIRNIQNHVFYYYSGPLVPSPPSSGWIKVDNSCNDNFTITGNVTQLPVELLSFEAVLKDQTTVLSWQTATEENNAGFEIQHTTDGVSWDVLTFVEGKGTTLETHNYTYIDENPSEGINYYRMKQIDFDGQFVYLKVVTVELDLLSNDDIKIYPNPVIDNLFIEHIETIENIIIYNSIGQPVRQITVSEEQQLSVDVSDLAKGLYTLQLQKTNGDNITKQFVK